MARAFAVGCGIGLLTFITYVTFLYVQFKVDGGLGSAVITAIVGAIPIGFLFAWFSKGGYIKTLLIGAGTSLLFIWCFGSPRTYYQTLYHGEDSLSAGAGFGLMFSLFAFLTVFLIAFFIFSLLFADIRIFYETKKAKAP